MSHGSNMPDKADIKCSREMDPGDAVSHAVSGVPVGAKHNESGFQHLFGGASFSTAAATASKVVYAFAKLDSIHKVVNGSR